MLIDDRKILIGYASGHLDPSASTSLFSSETAPYRQFTLDAFKYALRDEVLPDDALRLMCMALWTFEMGLLLYFVQDKSEGAQLTHQLVDGALKTLFPVVQLASAPMMAPVLENALTVLSDAGLTETSEPSSQS